MPVRRQQERQRQQKAHVQRARPAGVDRQQDQQAEDALIEAAEEVGIDLPREQRQRPSQPQRQRENRRQEG